MPFQIQVSNILAFQGDAIICPIYKYPRTARDLQTMIASKESLINRLGLLRTKAIKSGNAVMTRSSGLRCSYVIYTKLPRWTEEDSVKQLRNCYRNSLALAAEYGIRDIALPLIGRGFPQGLALRLAEEEITAFLAEHDDINILVVIPRKVWLQPDQELLDDLKLYINWAQTRQPEWGLPENLEAFRLDRNELRQKEKAWQRRASEQESPVFYYAKPYDEVNASPNSRPQAQGTTIAQRRRLEHEEQKSYYQSEQALYESLPDAVFSSTESEAFFSPGQRMILDESFSQMLLRMIDERGFQKDSDFYKKANMDKRLFHKIKTNIDYHPKKTTALAAAVALELSPEQTKELLMKAGYTLSHSILFDVIVEYFILQKNYNIFEINELLFEYDQPLLGA